MSPITPKKVVGAALVGAGVYVAVGALQRAVLGDLSFCDTCGMGHSGYGFVAYATGADPKVCPSCQNQTLRPARFWDFAKAVVLGR